MTRIKSCPLIAMACVIVLCSCFSMKSIHGKYPLSRETLQTLKLNTLYEFELRSGQSQLVTLTDIKFDTLTGYYFIGGPGDPETKTPYAFSFDDVLKHVTRISTRKVNVPATITVAALAHVTLVTIIGYSLWNSDDW